MVTFEAALREHHMFEEARDLDDFHTVYKFGISEDLDGEIIKFLEGKYSKFNRVIKERILKFHNTKKEREIGQILYKSTVRREKLEEDLKVKIPRDIDLLDPPDPLEEILLNSYLIDND